jgi:hypothetical protein
VTGPEHYQRAEQLLDRAAQAENPADLIAAAAVHAQLAAVAVAALRFEDGLADADFDAWDEAAGVVLDSSEQAAS